jgi:hypothetical protein
MTRLEYVADALRRKLPAFNHRLHGSYAEFMARAALDALRDPRFAQGDQVTVNRALLAEAVTVPPYVLDAPDDKAWILVEAPDGWNGIGKISTGKIKALRYAAAMNE